MYDTVFKSDDTGAFGIDFITINFKNPLGYIVTKAEFMVVNNPNLPNKEFDNPVFPLRINFDRTETAKFLNVNICRLRVYDENGLRKTCKNTLTFYAEDGAITDVRCE